MSTPKENAICHLLILPGRTWCNLRPDGGTRCTPSPCEFGHLDETLRCPECHQAFVETLMGLGSPSVPCDAE